MSRQQNDDDEYRQFIKDKLRDLDSLTAKLPRGSLSGGVDIFDPLDPNTWHAPDAPDSYRKDAVELYGITPDKVSDGLSQREKRELHQVGTKTIEGVSPEQFRQAKRTHERYAKASQTLWNTMKLLEPNAASDPTEVARAAQRLAAKNGLSLADAADLMERHPKEAAAAIADEMYEEDYATNSSSDNRPDHRTQMVTDGGGHWNRQPSEDEAGDMMEELKDFQRRTGWHR